MFSVTGCSRIDSTILSQHAVCNNLEEEKEEETESVAVLESVGPVPDRIL